MEVGYEAVTPARLTRVAVSRFSRRYGGEYVRPASGADKTINRITAHHDMLPRRRRATDFIGLKRRFRF